MDKDLEQSSVGQTPSSVRSIVSRPTEPRSIVVNGRRHPYRGDRIGTKELVRLAFPGSDDLANAALTVAYEGGPLQAQSGLLPANASTPVAEGQSFSVSLTNKS